MKIIVCLTILTLSLASVVHAGLDSDNMVGHVIAVYHFESVKQSEGGLKYTTDSGPRKFHAPLFDGASLSTNGKYGKSLLLREESQLYGGSRELITLSNDEFSVVYWVKIPKQQKDVNFLISLFGDMEQEDGDDLLVSTIGTLIKPDGNVSAVHLDFLRGGGTIGIATENQNVANDRWHHIAFTKYAGVYKLFVDGRYVAETVSRQNIRFLGNFLSIKMGASAGDKLTGSVFVDDAGFFETGFSSYEVKGLYNSKLSTFLEEMSVTPQGHLTTTWGEIKSRR